MDALTVNRLEKARLLADVLVEVGATSDDVLALDVFGWRTAALVAGMRRGSPMSEPSDATKTLVFHRLQTRERLEREHGNPLDGIGVRG